MHKVTPTSGVRAALVGLTLLAAPAASAADHPLLTTVLGLCRPNHSRPGEVVAAAKRSGWTETMAVGGGATLMKDVDGASQILILSAKPITLGEAPAVFNACQASGGLSGGDLLASVRALMGGDPQVSSGPRATSWLFTEHNGQRRFLPDGSLETVAATLKTGPVMIVRVPPSGGFVEYNEISRGP